MPYPYPVRIRRTLISMHIELRPIVQVLEGTPVGLLDGKPLVYHGRTPSVAGHEYLPAEIGPSIVDAVDRAACLVWGSSWKSDLARVSNLNRRTFNSDRIEKFGLPAWMLTLLGKAASYPNPRSLGYMTLAVCELLDTQTSRNGCMPGMQRTPPTGNIEPQAHHMLDYALDMVLTARSRKTGHRLR
jgi:hypothetical protein